jgi:uncharacterized protein
MTVYFADTSAFAKRYLPEVGFQWVRSWIEPSAQNTILISEIGTIEFFSVLARQRRHKNISASAYTRLTNDFLVHVHFDYQVVGLSQLILADPRYLVDQHPLRTLDAIQLASALAAVRSLGVMPMFVTADSKLLAVAAAEGFPIDNPYNHP